MELQLSKPSIRRGLLCVAALLLALPLLGQPTARGGATMVYSPEARASVLFGGVTGADSSGITYEMDDTWLFSAHRWIQIYPEHSPSPRTGSGMVYDKARNEVVLFGGSMNTDSYNDTWVFKDRDWSEVTTADAPEGRRLPAIAYDPELGKTVLFGGVNASGSLFDTWEFDGTNWTQISTSGPTIYGSSMVWDDATHQLLLLGRSNETVPTTTDTIVMYEFNGTDWTELTPDTLPPCVGQAHPLYQQKEQNVMFYAGTCASGGRYSTTYIWDGTTWTETVIDFLLRPGQLGVYAAAYDPVYQESVIFGGVSGANSFSTRTWAFKNSTWTRIYNEFSPGPRTQFIFAPVPDQNMSLLFGGWNTEDTLVDLWQFSDGGWRQINASGAPADCPYPVGDWDAQQNKLMVFCATALMFDYDGTQWNFHTTGNTWPSSRNWSMMAWDPVSKKSMLFGGFDGLDYLNDLWEWDGTNWTKGSNKNAPDGRDLAAFFYDPHSQKMILFGGLGRHRSTDVVQRYNDMWSYDGTKWTALNPTTKPTARYGMQWAFDSNGDLIMFGGKDDKDKYSNEVWKWDGSNWEQMEDANVPAPRMNGRMILDPTTGKVTLYGGYAGFYYSQYWTRADDGTWTLHPEHGHPRGVPMPGEVVANAPTAPESESTTSSPVNRSKPAVERPGQH